MSLVRQHPERGSLVLVVLCFVAVLGIGLASYVALCSRAMQLSNRSVQTGLSKQIAESALEEALRALNKNDWSGWSTGSVTVTWSDNGTNGKKATISFPSSKFGQGVTASAKIRIDNANYATAGTTWSSSATYRIGDLVGYNGIWYRSVRNGNLNQTPSNTNLTWWVANPMPWTWSSDRTYAQYEMVNYKGLWYRCIAVPPVSAGTTTYAPAVPLPATTYWTPIPTMRAWAASTAYSVYDVVAYTDPTTSDVSLYRCTTAHTSSASFSSDTANWSSNVQTVNLSWSSGSVYTRGAMVYYIGASVYRWYYCIQSGTSSTAPSSDTTMWAPVWYDLNSSPGPCAVYAASDTPVVGAKYYVGDYAYITSASAWYRCTTAHTYVSWAASSGNWIGTNANPYLQLFYFGGSAGSLSITSNSIFYYVGTYWYRYMGGYSYLGQAGSMPLWTSGYKYNLGDAVYYSSTSKWYRCILAHTASATITPSNTTYWATTPVHSSTWSSTRQYSQYGRVFYNGVWYLSLQNSNIGQNPATATTYWIGANTSTTSYQWNATTAYNAGDYKCYDGVWYQCTTGNTGASPNDTGYWTASWANSWGVTTGAPVIYAEGTVSMAGNPSVKTQLRAVVAPAAQFPNAVAANASTITANSGGTVDSYDSTSGTVAAQGGGTTVGGFSNSGTYAGQVGTSTNYSAVIASAYSASTAITLSSTDVKGYLAAPSSSTTPFAPLYSSGGTVKGYTSTASPNIDLAHISRTPYIPKFDTIPGGSGGLTTNWSVVPKGTLLSLPGTSTGSANIGTPGDTVPSRYYYSSSLTIGGASIQYLNINGPVILYISGDLFITNSSGNNGRINVSSTGSAEIHVTGVFKADAGGEGILSYNSDPKSLIIISDTTNTTTQFYSEGVNDLYGVIYMPYSTSTNGFYNDNNATEIFGAVSANKVTYSGANLNVHYDTSLRYATFGGVDQPFAITQWRELTDPVEQATMP